MNDLLPCPFCGGKAERYDITDEHPANQGGTVIQCSVCFASSPVHFDRKENLVGSWNARVSDPFMGASREIIAEKLAWLDGITLQDVRSTVGPAEDANNWREYLGRADDLLAFISEAMAR